MSLGSDVDRCFAFVACQVKPPAVTSHPRTITPPAPAVTMSCQTGAGGMAVARKLADYLQAHRPATCGWTVFDRELVEKVLQEHNLPQQLGRYMQEDRISAIRDMIEEVLGLHPSAYELHRQTVETVMHLAELGNVILIGRGANIITRRLPHVFHVRLVATEEFRVAALRESEKLDSQAARDFLHKDDAARRRYVKEHYGADINDPNLYDLMVRVDRLSPDEIVHLLGHAVMVFHDRPCDPSRLKTPATAGLAS